MQTLTGTPTVAVAVGDKLVSVTCKVQPSTFGKYWLIQNDVSIIDKVAFLVVRNTLQAFFMAVLETWRPKFCVGYVFSLYTTILREQLSSS